METSWLHAYVDETGTNDLETSKSGVSLYFITVAVIVEDKRVGDLTRTLNSIAEDYCGGAEIKSSSIGGKHSRRLKFLRAINPLDFGYYALVVKKDAVWNDSGLQFKSVFYKFINKMLYQRLIHTNRSIRIVADEIGGKFFMDSFTGYLERQLKPDLFFQFQHEFANSSDCRLIQLADLIAGTLGYRFEPDKKCEHSAEFREILKTKELAIDSWPDKITRSKALMVDDQPSDDLTNLLLFRVTHFIEKKESSFDPIEQMQVTVLRNLLFVREFESPGNQIISSDRLIQQLVDQGFDGISKRAFMKEVIGGIRFEGIILAGTHNGYRLALTQNDINEYLAHNKTIIEPMLTRLYQARKAVKFDTLNRVDILEPEPFKLLGKLVDCTSEEAMKLESN